MPEWDQGWDRKKKSYGNYDQNVGVPGVVYVLENEGLRSGFVKIGCTRHSGGHRARSLNDDANTGTPGTFHCVFEFRTLDCGLAEQRVFAELAERRRGKWGQEFFEVELAPLREVIERTCRLVDEEVALRPPASVAQPIAVDSSAPVLTPGMRPPPWMRPKPSFGRKRGRSAWHWSLFPVALVCLFWFKPALLPTAIQRWLLAHVQPVLTSQSGAANAPATPGRSRLAGLNAEERKSLEAVCNRERPPGESDADDRCQKRLLVQLSSVPRPDLSGLSSLELFSIGAACSRDQMVSGPAALRTCQARQVAKLKAMPTHVNVNSLSRDVRMSVDAACLHIKHTLGPADYYQCVANRLDQMGSSTQ